MSILPVGTGSSSISSYIKGAINEIEEEGLKYTITPTSIVIEGDIDTLLEISKKLHKKSLERTNRVVINIQIDDRTDKTVTIDRLVETARM
ncbi:MTH1187 family thiamine-binding protein [Natranaerobius trueperi]|uniref:MTH1187 family thiamine-binding protein n=1 Tax=Natranaerobius trueperi TaxID=759412 RepID=UPI00197BBFF9|nr:MTH1187 family thiamine-binding protein [Natranaerobius trueperi]